MTKTTHKKAKRKYKAGTPERAAIEAITPERYEKGHWTWGNARKMLEGSEVRDVDSIHRKLAVPVKALWSFVKPNAKRKVALLEPIHIQAANAYHADLLTLEGQYSHEIGVFVDRSRAEPRIDIMLIEAGNRIAGIRLRMNPKMYEVIQLVFVTHPDKSMAEIWPDKYSRRVASKLLVDGMHWLTVEYNLKSN